MQPQLCRHYVVYPQMTTLHGTDFSQLKFVNVIPMCLIAHSEEGERETVVQVCLHVCLLLYPMPPSSIVFCFQMKPYSTGASNHTV